MCVLGSNVAVGGELRTEPARTFEVISRGGNVERSRSWKPDAAVAAETEARQSYLGCCWAKRPLRHQRGACTVATRD